MRKLGRIQISESILLEWLDFPNASIREVSYNIDNQAVEVYLESSEMPQMQEGDAIPLIDVAYTLINNKPVRIRKENIVP